MKKIVVTPLLTMSLLFPFVAHSKDVIEAKGKNSVSLTYLGSKVNCIDNHLCMTLGWMTWGAGYIAAPLFRKDVAKTNTYKVKTKMYVSVWGEGKARVGVSFKGKKKCADLDIMFDALALNSATYQLFVPETQYDQGEVNMEPVGELVILSDEMRIVLNEGIQGITNGRKDHQCGWEVKPDTAIVGSL
jgi:hypothetical protein